MVREVSFTNSEETRDRSLQFIVNPDTTHCVVDSREDHHWSFVWIIINDFFIHLEEVTITSFNCITTKTFDSIFEVEIYSKTCRVNTETSVATFFSSTRSYVTRYEVTECWVTTFQVEVAVFIRNFSWFLFTSADSLSILFFLRNPDTTIVTERLRHKSQFRLECTVYRNTSRVDLSEARVSKPSTFFVALESS